MKTLNYFVALALITAVFYSCQKDETESISEIEQDVAVLKTEAVETGFNSNCIDAVSDQVVVNWGGPNGERFSKTVDIEYYNTLDDFVLKVVSTEDIANLLVDNKSVKQFSTPLPADTWYELTFPLPNNWEESDDFSFELSVIGNGPQAVFDVEYQLVGECAEPVTFTYNGVEVTYGVVKSAGRYWLDRNLGASRAAESSTDGEAYGDLFQWGREADGHQLRNSSTTLTLSSSDTPGHGNFIVASTSSINYDWRNPENNDLWQGTNGINNPCPEDYRLPTEEEWEAERKSWSSNNAAGAFGSPLKLPAAGSRSGNTASSSPGSIGSVGSWGVYWSSTVLQSGINNDAFYSMHLQFNSFNTGIASRYRAAGYSVRCIKNIE